jgi:hypothetical protein
MVATWMVLQRGDLAIREPEDELQVHGTAGKVGTANPVFVNLPDAREITRTETSCRSPKARGGAVPPSSPHNGHGKRPIPTPKIPRYFSAGRIVWR